MFTTMPTHVKYTCFPSFKIAPLIFEGTYFHTAVTGEYGRQARSMCRMIIWLISLESPGPGRPSFVLPTRHQKQNAQTFTMIVL